MIKKERVLVDVPNQGGNVKKDERIYAVHPNYVLE
jgi:hypothetical protein